MKNLHRVGPSSFTYTLAYSKSNQTAADRPENVKPLEGIAGEALQAWLTTSGIVTVQYSDRSGKAVTLENPSPLLPCEISFESAPNLPGCRRCFLLTR